MENIASFQVIYDFVVQHYTLSYLIIFISSILEATIFVGLLIPTGILIMIFGFISYNGYLVAEYIILTALVGAILGDVMNYALGKYHVKKRKLTNLEKIDNSFLFKKRKYIDHGRDLFDKHGGKSIIIGRFLGMVRPFISFVSGTADVPFMKFLLLNIFGAFLWILLYFGIGYIFGSSAPILSEIMAKMGNITLLLTFLIALFIYLRSIFNQKMEERVFETVDDEVEKIEK